MGKKNIKWSIDHTRMEGWLNHPSIRFFMYIILGFIMYLLLMGQVIPKTYELNEGQISQETLISPITVVDDWVTNIKKEQAAKSVSDVYTRDDTIVNDQVNQLDLLFENIFNLNAQADITKQEKLKKLNNLQNLSFLNESSLEMLASLSIDKVKNLNYITKTTLDVVMNNGVKITELDEANLKIEELIKSNPFDNDEKIKKLANEVTKHFVKPNIFYNSSQTLLLRNEAKSNVQPVVIKKDELIVKKGQYIDKQTYEKLRAAGLLKDTSTLWPHFGLFILVTLLSLLLFYSIERMKPILHQDNKSLTMIFIIFVLTFASIRVFGIGELTLTSPIGFLAPVALGVMLITIFINMKLAILSGAIFSVFVSLVFSTDQTIIFDFRYGFVALIGSTAGAYALGQLNRRSSVLKAGLIVALFNMLATSVILTLANQSYTLKESIEAMLYAGSGGIFSAILTIGLMPFFESVFGILSQITLIELSNPNHPLLRKLLIETPGTYHHSIIVGNLSESAAEAIDANGLLARVGAYYHDLGKTKRPTFFIENQLNMENPHDKISSSLSKNIIISHTKDGVQMLKEYKIPIPIQDIALQHHGTSLLKYFYHKALKESDEILSEDDYRYPGPKPQTKEAAIVSLADSIEAAVRSMSNPTNEKIEEMVRKIIKSKLDDGQLNECDLTLKEIEIISVSMLETLKGIFHSRIEYPDDKELELQKGEKSS